MAEVQTGGGCVGSMAEAGTAPWIRAPGSEVPRTYRGQVMALLPSFIHLAST